MPELPEVETIARDLAPLITGATFTDVATDWPRVVASPAPEAFRAGLVGRAIVGVGRRAKWLLLDLDDGSVLAVQVKMTGQVFVVPEDAPMDRHVHLVLRLDDGRELRLRDIRKFGRVGLYPRGADGEVLGGDGAAPLFARHGPEPLEADFTLRVFRDRLRARRGRLKPILLDQSFIAGVGNIYADEALWRARLHPLRSVGTLRPADERRLYLELRAVLAEAIERRGSSVDDYMAPQGDGEMQDHLEVYQRTGLPCLRCGRPLRRIVVGGRGTHFCSWCQRLPATDRPGARAILRETRAGRGGAVAPEVAARRAETTKKAAATRRAAIRRGTRWSELPAGPGIVGSQPDTAADSARADGGASGEPPKAALPPEAAAPPEAAG